MTAASLIGIDKGAELVARPLADGECHLSLHASLSRALQGLANSGATHLLTAPEWSAIQMEMIVVRLVVVRTQDYVEIAARTVVRGP
jgi:hypothetical protein